MPGAMRVIAEFLEIPNSESMWDTIREYCSFDEMKKNAPQSVRLGGTFWDADAQEFIHRVVNGRWGETLTTQELMEYEARADAKLGTDCAQ